jgi:hypothetical protein
MQDPLTTYYVVKVVVKHDNQFGVLTGKLYNIVEKMLFKSKDTIETMRLLLTRFIIEQRVQRKMYFDRAVDFIQQKFPDTKQLCDESV